MNGFKAEELAALFQRAIEAAGRDGDVDPIEVCIAAAGVMTAYLESIPDSQMRLHVLSSCTEMVRDAVGD